MPALLSFRPSFTQHAATHAAFIWAYHLVLAAFLPGLAGVIRVGDINCCTMPLKMLETEV